MTLNERIKRAGITKKKLAAELGVTPQQLSYWLNGTREIPEDAKRRLNAILERVERCFG